MFNYDDYLTIDFARFCWHTWNANGYRVRSSKNHIEHLGLTGMTFCGQRIPVEGNGIEYGEQGEGECKRCTAAAEKYIAD